MLDTETWRHYIMSTLNMSTYDKSQQDSVYHVKVDNDTDSIVLVCIGTDCVDSPLSDGYYCGKDIPEWLISKIAVLSIATHATDDIIGNAWVDGIGKRIDEDTYWVNAP